MQKFLLDTGTQSSKYKFYEVLKNLPVGQFEITIKPYEKSAAHKGNGYYFGYLLKEFCLQTGYDVEEAREILEKRFLKHEFHENGKIKVRVKSITELTTEEADFYFLQVRQFIWHEFKIFLI